MGGWAGGETPHSRDVAVALVRKLNNLSNLAGLGDGQVVKGGRTQSTQGPGDEPGASLACSYAAD